jgi:hypothetical protein
VLLIFPQFDQCYPLLTAALAVLWRRALLRNSAYLASQFGVFMAMTLLITYLPAVLVIFLAGYAGLARRMGQNTWRQIAKAVLIALVAFVAFYVVLWLGTRFNPIASFRACWANQQENMRFQVIVGNPPRTWPGTIPGDFKDFALGTGWISYLIAAMFFVRKQSAPRRVNVAILGLIQIAAVGALGLIRCETARVWIFLIPLLMLPVGLELARWNWRWRMGVYLALLCVTVASWHSMTFFPP